MEKDLKKIALCGLAAGLACLSAQEAPSAMESQEDSSKEVSMSKGEGGYLIPEDCPTKEECTIGRDRTSCRANCGCGSAPEAGPTDKEGNPVCKKPPPPPIKRKGAAKQAMED